MAHRSRPVCGADRAWGLRPNSGSGMAASLHEPGLAGPWRDDRRPSSPQGAVRATRLAVRKSRGLSKTVTARLPMAPIRHPPRRGVPSPNLVTFVRDQGFNRHPPGARGELPRSSLPGGTVQGRNRNPVTIRHPPGRCRWRQWLCPRAHASHDAGTRAPFDPGDGAMRWQSALPDGFDAAPIPRPHLARVARPLRSEEGNLPEAGFLSVGVSSAGVLSAGNSEATRRKAGLPLA